MSSAWASNLIGIGLPKDPREFKGLKVGVIGLGETGCTLSEKLLNWGAEVIAIDSKPIWALKACKKIKELTVRGLTAIGGTDEAEELFGCQLVVLSPSVRPDKPFIERLRSRGIKVTGEIELAYAMCKGRIIAITGTNGKTTTATLVHHMLETSGVKAFLVGNIGTPAISCVDIADETSWLVMEVSSFQLMTCEAFRPNIGIITNIAADHLDWHRDIEEYISAKAKLLRMQHEDDFAVLNSDDDGVRKVMHVGAAKRVLFGLGNNTANVRLVGKKIVADIPEVGIDGATLCTLEDMQVCGEHNILNVMAASAAALLSGVSPDSIRGAIASFAGVPHRLEVVGEIDGVKFINDSAATSPHAALQALRSIDAPIIWVAGGENKGLDFGILSDAVKRRVKTAVLIGSAAMEIAEFLMRLNVPFKLAGGLEEAVSLAFNMASRGDVVLLSPACRSLDMFENYAERGEQFRVAVKRLSGVIKND
ncbi:MAG: UDP-N-acetylmuramoyl-L-alanine--D-glutamate ligase [Armatimonadota bacterium]|nr:UDP-N-acetylmuramoyl-L-alanine--D-glutamate ligase [Armatimonadota bacterium]MCX7777577.1 UDP-N-acetylmuramoyl-L-alanine--D-glutamate ligase [Armatimonadota bacterium]MDW8025586.1 UDP-N-acetylmuramoyl-L-alanine--D-glutamate ligase [Armatimonadota bacterium]